MKIPLRFSYLFLWPQVFLTFAACAEYAHIEEPRLRPKSNTELYLNSHKDSIASSSSDRLHDNPEEDISFDIIGDLDYFKNCFFHPSYTETSETSTLSNREIFDSDDRKHNLEEPASFVTNDSVEFEHKDQKINDASRNTMHQISTHYGQYRNLHKLGLLFSKWQEDYSEESLRTVYLAILDFWGTNISPADLKRCNTSLSRLLTRREKIRISLMDGDKETLKYVAHQTCPMQVKKRMKKIRNDLKPDEQKSDSITDVLWLAVQMSKAESDYIEARLYQYWNMSKEKGEKLLVTYAERYGAITSPEPLLDSNQVLFNHAADLIFVASQGRREWSEVPLVCQDVLHQTSQDYELSHGKRRSIYDDYLLRRTKDDVKRHKSQSWHHGRSPSWISAIHAAIASHWREGMDKQTLYRRIDEVNGFLQDHPLMLAQVIDGNEKAAYITAAACIRRSEWMREFKSDMTSELNG